MKQKKFSSPGEGLDGLIIFSVIIFSAVLWKAGIRHLDFIPGLVLYSILFAAGIRTIWGQFLG